MPLMQFSMYTGMLLVSWFGARLIVGGSMTTGQLTSMISYSIQILVSLMMFSMVLVMITISRASAQRISEILKEESDLGNGDDPVHEVRDGSVRFRNVDFSYTKDRNKLVLSGIDLEIRSGETVGSSAGRAAPSPAWSS
jgi:ATP-binding cassette subfamily B protein